jgi:hypothetical protein
MVCMLFALLNITMERLLGAWIEKLLAKRRAREVFFSLFILAMISLQFINPIAQKYGRAIVPAVRGWLPYLWILPSSFAGDALARAIDQEWASMALKIAGLAVYLVLFSAFLWIRLYSGEELSETAAPAESKSAQPLPKRTEKSGGFFRRR